MVMRVGAVLVLILVGCGVLQCDKRPASANDDSVALQQHQGAWPTFEPFDLRAKGPPDDLAVSERDLSQILSSLSIDTDPAEGLAREEGEAAPTVPWVPPKPTREELHRIGFPTVEEFRLKMWWQDLPEVMIHLQPLYLETRWTEGHLAVARLAQDFFAMNPDAPHPQFEKGENAKNHAQLEAVAGWFRRQVQDPLRYGAMIRTMSLGPNTGRPTDIDPSRTPVAQRRIDDHLELRLLPIQHGERHVAIAAFRDGEPLWSRLLTERAGDPIDDLCFADRPPVQLGTYGWLVNLRDGESYSLYLDRDGGFLFYFASW
ncbi:MAG: hypothetical protein ABH877_02750 [bacterium]